MRPIISWLLFILVFPSYVFSQTEPQFTQYMYNRYLFNPAYAGSEDAVEVGFLHRSQYVGLNSRMIFTQGFTINLPVYAIQSGIGVTAINDMIGLQRATYVSLNYNYRKKFAWGKMGIGIGAGIIQTSLDGSKVRTPEGDYRGDINHNDDYLPDNLQQGIAPDLSFGIYFNSDRYFAGAAINHIAFSTAAIKAMGGSSSLNFSRHLIFSGGYDFIVSPKLKIMPSALLKTDLHKVQADVSATFTIINNILTGISFRGYTKKTIDAFVMMVGYRYKGFQVVYSYDANISYLSKFNSGSHEISFRYRYMLGKRENPGYFYHNPRYNK